MKSKRLILIVLVVFLFNLVSGRPVAAAAEPTPPLLTITPANVAAAAEPTPPLLTITPANVAAVVDEFVAANMEAAHVPGLAVVVVHGGEVVLAQGYGYADLATGRPMTAATPVRAGSVAKPVTALAVLQLAAQGRVDLNAPISDYITDLPLADDLGPVPTVAQLLALQGGYPDTVLQVHAPTSDEWQPLGDYLAQNLPPRVLPAGVAYSYNSWEHGLLGYVLEQVTGLPFDAAVADLVFTPLGLEQSTFSQPLPPALAADLAAGYAFNGAGYDTVPLDYVNLSPGIALVTTAGDMGDLLLALLDGESLPPAVTAGALNRQLPLHPALRARTFAFSELNVDNRTVLYHDGNGIGFSNRALLAPDADFGLFVTVNHRPLAYDASPTAANRFMRDLSAMVTRSFVPDGPAPQASAPMAVAAAGVGQYAGHYQLAGTPPADFFKVGALLDNVDVRANDDGTLQIGSGRYVAIEPGLFEHETDPARHVLFIEDDAGAGQYLTFGGTGTYHRAPWYGTLNFQLALILSLLLVFVPVAVVWPIRRTGPALTWLVSSLNLAFLIGFAALLLGADLIVFFKEIPLGARVLLTYPWLAALLAGPLLWQVAGLWRAPVGRWTRFGHSAAAAAALVFLWFVFYWRLFL